MLGGFPPPFIGQTKVVRELLRQAQIVADSPSTVLLQGESGTGKELLARVIHAQSSQGERPFVPIDCGALVEESSGSEFFGQTLGMAPFAPADQTAAAHGGALFLDDIENLPLRLQAGLLRFLENRGVGPIGSQRPVEVRIIASTQHDLRQAVQAGRFRKDLYYQIAAVRLVLPPLSYRRQDIPLLAEHFLQRSCAQFGVVKKSIPHRTMQILLNAPWPGNVRELMATIERLVLFSPGPEICPDSLQPDLPEQTVEGTTSPHEAVQARAVLERIERDKLRAALLQTGNNRTEAAKLLGVSRATFYVKAKRYGLALHTMGKRTTDSSKHAQKSREARKILHC